jgi:hypothetical protein
MEISKEEKLYKCRECPRKVKAYQAKTDSLTMKGTCVCRNCHNARRLKKYYRDKEAKANQAQ